MDLMGREGGLGEKSEIAISIILEIVCCLNWSAVAIKVARFAKHSKTFFFSFSLF